MTDFRDDVKAAREERTGDNDAALIAIVTSTRGNDPHNVAAAQLLAERKEKKEEERHREVVGEARQANRLAWRAIIIAIFALIVALAASFRG